MALDENLELGYSCYRSGKGHMKERARRESQETTAFSPYHCWVKPLLPYEWSHTLTHLLAAVTVNPTL